MSENHKLFLFYKLSPWVWGLAMFIGTSLPTDYIPKLIILAPDKLLHIGAFFVFTILVYRALSIQKNEMSLRRQFVVSTVLITIGYGVFDELHQYFIPGRSPDVFDILADVVGIGLGLVAIKIYRTVTERRNKIQQERSFTAP